MEYVFLDQPRKELISCLHTAFFLEESDDSERRRSRWDRKAGTGNYLALVAGHVGLSEERIRVISPDIGGGFGGKVPVYPGYVIAVAASVLTGKPVKWIEDRSENLQADSFARDYHIKAAVAAKKSNVFWISPAISAEMVSSTLWISAPSSPTTASPFLACSA